ncbi:hypothetical protein TH30_14910 [Thalassospira profundimaris]|uniref:Uncharacterized protein n=1 Tax=Thalassospira profundimaris TaxID=502049 RepID=A0A367WT68_9PROT|nr:hypothetical protein TH30_14910 [Thalassospira profundimaris]
MPAFWNERSIYQESRHQKQQNSNGDNAPENELGPVVPARFMDLDQFDVVVASLHCFLPNFWAQFLGPIVSDFGGTPAINQDNRQILAIFNLWVNIFCSRIVLCAATLWTRQGLHAMMPVWKML